MHYCTHSFIENKYFDELKALSAPMREATVFKHYLEEIPVFIEKNDVFAGRYGYAEMPVSDKKGDFEFVPVLSDAERESLEKVNKALRTDIHYDIAHTLVDYETVINEGLVYYLKKINAELEKEPENEYLRAMKLSVESTKILTDRFASLALSLAEKAENAAEKIKYTRMYEALNNVPMYPARDFYEAVQSLWLMHTLVPMAEKAWYSISIGRVDQYLYRFYDKAIISGDSKDDIKAILKHLFILLDSYGDGASAMNIGGTDENGEDMINELSRLFIEVEKEMCLRAPIFALRVGDKTPLDVIDSVIDFNLFKIGQPTFYSEKFARKAVMSRGISEKEATNFSANSCMGLILPGKEIANMWAMKYNSHLALELAINNGKPMNFELGFELKTPTVEPVSFETVLSQYEKYNRELLSICAELYVKVAREWGVNHPDPFLSAITDGCIDSRADRAANAKYDTVTVETFALVNTCDALQAIFELVFEKKKYTLDNLIEAAKSSYEGFDEIRKDILQCKKFGMNEPSVNKLFGIMAKGISESCEENKRDNFIFLPSLHTIDANIAYGMSLYATLDGRKEGMQVCKNANPSVLLKKFAHTEHIMSALSFDQTRFSGGQPIDLYFEKAWFDTEQSRAKVRELVLTYLRLGGLQLQVNSVDIELLEIANEAPADYPFVIVRKGGYSVRFNEMDRAGRDSIITHAKLEEL